MFPFHKYYEKKKNNVIYELKCPLEELKKTALATPQKNYQGGSLYSYQVLTPYANIKKHYCLKIYRNILVDNTKIIILSII